MKLNKRKCQCGKWFQPSNSLQKACCIEGARKIVNEAKEKKARKQQREDKKRIRDEDRSYQLQKAQVAFNRYIRLRDKDEPCISCGKYDWEIKDVFTGGKWDAGHFKSRGAFPELRFEELNTHKQCKSCNGGSGKFARKDRTVSQEYKKRLIEKIGEDAVDWLEGPHDPLKLSIADIKEIRKTYELKAKELKNG